MSFLPIVHWGVSQLRDIFSVIANSNGISNTYDRHGYVLSDLGFENSHVSSTMSPRELWHYAYDMYGGAASHLYVHCSCRLPPQPLGIPASIRAMLLWLLCLLPSGQVKGLSNLGDSISKVLQRCSSGVSYIRGASPRDGLTTLRQFHATMYHFMVTVPSVFLVMEGNLAGLFTGMYKFLGSHVSDAHTTSHDSSHSLVSSTNRVVERQLSAVFQLS